MAHVSAVEQKRGYMLLASQSRSHSESDVLLIIVVMSAAKSFSFPRH